MFAALILACVTAALLSGFFLHRTTLGAHDWDFQEGHRYVAVKSIREFGQFPFWDPYGCGGFPAWGSAEGGTIVVSPFLPVYLALPLAAAVRVEVTVMIVLFVLGVWFFARRYLQHPLAIAFVCLVAALSSRVALQIAVGHTWHLAYAFVPWVLGAYDRALDGESATPRRRFGWVAFGAVVFAWMLYSGGIYPAPHAALCLVVLGAYRARVARTWRPLRIALAIPAWGALLAAPKVLAVVETMARFPRFVDSHEVMDPLTWIRIFVSSAASIPGPRVPGLDYMWHEYAQFIGVVPLALIAWGVLQKPAPESPLRSLRVAGGAFLVLALGGYGPWQVLHALPLFSSQHVPSRFTLVAMLLLAVVAAGAVEARVPAWRAKVGGRLLGAAAWVLFATSAFFVAREDALCTRRWFSVDVGDVAERDDGYLQYDQLPARLSYGNGDERSDQGTNGAPGLLVRRANVGTIRCNQFAGLDPDAARGVDGRPRFLGARGIGDPFYRGEFWVEPSGHAELVRWTPNEVVLAVHGAKSGDLLVLNQNWAAGWSANGVPVADRANLAAHVLRADEAVVTFRYRPRTFMPSLALVAIGLAGPAALAAFRRRRGAPGRLSGLHPP